VFAQEETEKERERFSVFVCVYVCEICTTIWLGEVSVALGVLLWKTLLGIRIFNPLSWLLAVDHTTHGVWRLQRASKRVMFLVDAPHGVTLLDADYRDAELLHTKLFGFCRI
jgi:hypothetical protein